MQNLDFNATWNVQYSKNLDPFWKKFSISVVLLYLPEAQLPNSKQNSLNSQARLFFTVYYAKNTFPNENSRDPFISILSAGYS